MNWNDELCGVPVTPESWAGGIVENHPTCISTGVALPGHWEHVIRFARLPQPNLCLGQRGQGIFYVGIGQCAPIFPPAGWAGKTDAELWDALKEPWRGRWIGLSCLSLQHPGGARHTVSPLVVSTWLQKCGYEETEPLEPHELPALILEAQNAQVLARRLQQGR